MRPVVGSKVRLSSEGKAKYENSKHTPHDLTGVIYHLSDIVLVQCANGSINFYIENQLVKVNEFKGNL